MERYCPVCGSLNCGFDRCIIVADAQNLKRKEFYRIPWKVWHDTGLKQCEMPDAIQKVMAYNCCTVIQHKNGEPFLLRDFYEVFSEDKSCRWFNTYSKGDKSGQNPVTQSRCIERLQWLDITAKLMRPDMFQEVK